MSAETNGALGALSRPSRDADDEARSDSALLEATLDSTYDGIVVIDLDGRILRWNKRLVKMWRIPGGIVESEDIGRTLEYFTTQVADPTNFLNRLNTLLRTPEAEYFDVIELKDGRVFERYSLPLRIQDAIAGRVVSYRDVTAREEAQRSLRCREEQLAEQQRLAQIGSWEMNIRTGEAFWSDELFRIVGRSPEDLTPSLARFLDHVHDEDRRRVLDELGATAPDRVFDSTYRIVRADGAIRVVHSSGRLDEEDEQAFVIRGFSQDITDKHELEHQIHQSQKMNALGRLAGGIAHDLNNLLTAVFGSCEILHEEGLSERAMAAAAEIEVAASSAAALMGQLLNLSRQKPSPLQVFDVNSVLETLKPLLRSVVREDIQLEVASNVHEAHVRMQSSQFEQIILNLVINARDAMPHGGAITITIARADLDGTESFANEMTPGSYILVSVADTGVGMDKKTRDRAFEPFFTTKEDGEVRGTGLGLSSVYGIARHLGGNAVLESEVGGGTEVRVYLPEASDTAMTDVAAARIQKDLTGGETIVVVEDDRAVREVMRRGLGSYGYRVLAAADPHAAIQLSEEHEVSLDLLITDVVMPGMNGLEMADKARALHPDLKVLFVSGYPRDFLDGADFGEASISFLQKPIRLATLAAKVREILDRGFLYGDR